MSLCCWKRRRDQSYVLLLAKENFKAQVLSCVDNSSAWSAADVATGNWETWCFGQVFQLVPGKRFQVKDFENDMTIYISKTGLVQIITKQVKDVFQARETKWNTQQKILMKARIQATFDKLNNQRDYPRKLSQKFKSQGVFVC